MQEAELWLELYDKYLRKVKELAGEDGLEDEHLQAWVARCTRRKLYWARARDRLQVQEEREQAGLSRRSVAPAEQDQAVEDSRPPSRRSRDQRRGARSAPVRPQPARSKESRAAEWERLVTNLEQRALHLRALRTLEGGDGERIPLHRLWSDEKILGEIRQAAAEGDPGPGPFREGRRRPSLATITTRFGSWSVAESLALGRDRKGGSGA